MLVIRSKEDWVMLLEQELPSKESIVDRNRTITARYARWYLDNPEMFKWAGMAAFASRQVGVALAICELMHSPDHLMAVDIASLDNWFSQAAGVLMSAPLMLHRMASEQMLLKDLDEIRRGNNSIFRDIAWAHAAYLHGGLQEIENNAGSAEHELMIEGFRLIDQGMGMLRHRDADQAEAEEMIWSGNILLLRHEQIMTLQPVFDAISPFGRVIVSFGSELNFSGVFPPDSRYLASFSTHFGYLQTVAGISSVTDSGHRWQWIEENVLPLWRRLDSGSAGYSGLKQQLQSMAAGEQDQLQKVSSVAGGFFRQR
jgi:hypothetical protein